MSHHWDEFSKSLAQPVPRRESLRRLGVVLAGAVLSPMGLGTAFARGGNRDPCKSICRCRGKSDQNQCLAACHDCQQFGGRLCGGCGNAWCADVENDVYNCGACGYECSPTGQWEEGACIEGTCRYRCVEGAVACDGVCTSLDWDPFNCGECGNVCGGSTPICEWGTCTACPEDLRNCGGYCANLDWVPDNCGACGNVCPAATPYCVFGVCSECAAGEGKCGGVCIDLAWDSYNCGACGVVCPAGWSCFFGVCEPYDPGGGGGEDPPVNP